MNVGDFEIRSQKTTANCLSPLQSQQWKQDSALYKGDILIFKLLLSPYHITSATNGILYLLFHMLLNKSNDSRSLLTELSSRRVILKLLHAVTNMIAVTSLKHWIHFLLSSLCPPTSNILQENILCYIGISQLSMCLMWHEIQSGGRTSDQIHDCVLYLGRKHCKATLALKTYTSIHISMKVE